MGSSNDWFLVCKSFDLLYIFQSFLYQFLTFVVAVVFTWYFVDHQFTPVYYFLKLLVGQTIWQRWSSKVSYYFFSLSVLYICCCCSLYMIIWPSIHCFPKLLVDQIISVLYQICVYYKSWPHQTTHSYHLIYVPNYRQIGSIWQIWSFKVN